MAQDHGGTVAGGIFVVYCDRTIPTIPSLAVMERADICPESIRLDDGTVRPAPWMEWQPNAQQWRCALCDNSVTSDHLIAPRHTNRQEYYWNWYAHDVGQPIVQVVTHDLYVARPRNHNRAAAQQQPRHPRPAIQDAVPQLQQPAPPQPPPPAVVDGTQQQADIIELLRRMVDQNATIIELLHGTREEVSGLLRRVVENTQFLDVVANNAAMRGHVRAARGPQAAPAAPRATTPPPGAGSATVGPPPGLVQDD